MKQDYKIPTWINLEFVEKLLVAKKVGGKFTVKDFNVDSATQKGDNYASEMFRIIVNYSLEEEPEKVLSENFVLKKNHSDPKVDDMIAPYEFYTHEINCYKNLLPELHKLLRSIGEDAKLAPEMIYCELDNRVMVMEDLSLQNYKTGDKNKRFNMDVAKMTLRKLALFHAAGVVYNDQKNGELEAIKNKIFTVRDAANPMFDTFLQAAYEEVKSWGPEYEKYEPELKFMMENFYDIGEATLEPSPGMGVFMHGDMWLNNILLKMDENNQEKDVLLIDFQICGWASRAMDLLYFAFTTLTERDYSENIDEVLKYYNDVYTETMHKFNYKNVPSFEDLKAEFDKKLFYAYYGGVFVKSIIYNENSDNADIQYLMENGVDTFREQNFKSKRFQDEIKYLLKLFDEKRVWEEMRRVVA